MFRSALLALALASPLFACNTYHAELAGSERAFNANDYERTLVISRDLELDARRLSPQDQARYAWLRGMAHYRLGHRADARHWLAAARAIEDTNPGSLSPDAKQKAGETLDELNAVVYTEGTAALMAPANEGTEDRSKDRKTGPKARKGAPKSEEKKQEPPEKEAP
jgi:hypothetical protein